MKKSLLVSCLALLLAALPRDAAALTLTANTSINAGMTYIPEGSTTDSGQTFTETVVDGTPPEAFAAIAIDFTTGTDGFLTQIGGTGHALASVAALRVATSMDIDAYDPAITGEGVFAFASARYFDTYTLEAGAPGTLYLQPLFALDGSVASSGAPASTLTFTLRYFSFSALVGAEVVLRRVRAPTDGSFIAVNELVAGPLIPGADGALAEVDLRLLASTDLPLGTPLAAGSHDGFVDFDGTATFFGFALFEDAGGTVPYTGPASITGQDGRPVTVIPEPGSAALLGLGLSVLVAAARRGAAAGSAGRRP
jgi:hypothetical protein